MSSVYEIMFVFHDNAKIVMQFQVSLNEVDYCTESLITFIQKNKKCILAYDTLYSNISNLNILLKKALKHELSLHSTITKDIGYLFNQYSAVICGEKLKEPTFLVYIKKNNQSYWPGNDYHVWAKDYITWLYNNFDGSIIFEITPFYPYMYYEEAEKFNYPSYEEWIKTYKPYLIREIPIEVVQEWLKQTEYILQKIDSNVKLWKNAVE